MLVSANFQVSAPAPCKTRFHPRRQIAIEVAAGYLWLALRLPADTTRDEIEEFVGILLTRLDDRATGADIMADLVKLQADQLCEAVNLPTLHRLARRLMELLRDR